MHPSPSSPRQPLYLHLTLRYLSDYEVGPYRVVSLTKDESLTGPVVHKAVVVSGAHDGAVAAVAAIPGSEAALAVLDGAPGT